MKGQAEEALSAAADGLTDVQSTEELNAKIEQLLGLLDESKTADQDTKDQLRGLMGQLKGLASEVDKLDEDALKSANTTTKEKRSASDYTIPKASLMSVVQVGIFFIVLFSGFIGSFFVIKAQISQGSQVKAKKRKEK